MKGNVELQKALTTASGSGANLLPYDLSPVLYEELLSLQPLANLLPFIQAETKIHEYRLRTAHPQAWFEGEENSANNKESTYDTDSLTMKIQRIWGSVTGFSQAMSEGFVDALATELIGSVEGMSNVLEYGVMFGCANDIGFTGDALQFTGILPRIYKEASSNVIDAGGNKLVLGDLDEVIAASTEFRGSEGDPRFWMMNKQMRLVADGLQTAVQMPLRSLELFDGKITMGSYAGFPIVETSYLKPLTTSPSPRPTLTASTSGGTLPTSTVYNYRIASVRIEGEQRGGLAATTAATTASATASVALAWTADASAVSYMIFRQTAGTGDYSLIDIIPAKTYTNNAVTGTVAAYTDTGAKTPITTVNPLESGEYQILMVNANPLRGAALMYKNDSMGSVAERLFNYVELARTKDTYDYMIKSYLAMRLIYPEVCAVVRHAKLA